MSLFGKFKRFFSKRKHIAEGHSGKLIPVSVFLDNLQSSVKRTNDSCDIENSKFIRDYLTELPGSDKPDRLHSLTDELEVAISSNSMEQVQGVYRKIRKCNIAAGVSSHQLKTISVSMPGDSKTGETLSPVKIPLVSLSSLPANKISKLTLKTPLELVMDKDDEVCLRFPDRKQSSKKRPIETTSTRQMTTLDMVFTDDDQEISNLIKSFERLTRKM